MVLIQIDITLWRQGAEIHPYTDAAAAHSGESVSRARLLFRSLSPFLTRDMYLNLNLLLMYFQYAAKDLYLICVKGLFVHSLKP